MASKTGDAAHEILDCRLLHPHILPIRRKNRARRQISAWPTTWVRSSSEAARAPPAGNPQVVRPPRGNPDGDAVVAFLVVDSADVLPLATLAEVQK
jgi:hypothetical protein